MGSRFMTLLFGKGSNNKSDLRSQSYDTVVALDAPVKGSYPVAGNGPNVLEEIQRARAKRQSVAASTRESIAPSAAPTPASSHAPAPSISRNREPAIQRPRTAPHNGEPGGGQQPTKQKNGRTLSGFSMKSPPSFFSSSRRSSVSSTRRRDSIRMTAETPPPLPTSAVPAQTYIPTYQPKTGNGNGTSIRSGFTAPAAPFTQHHSRAASTVSHMSHIDLLDAHSHINRTREVSKHRTKASGVRNYGEDVADRNITEFGHKDKGNRESRLDLNSPEFSYLKQVYSPKKRQGATSRGEPHSRVDSALGHIHGSNGNSDDTSLQTPSYPRTSSIRSFTGPRPGVVYPPRIDSVNSHRTTTTSGGDNGYLNRTNGDGRDRALSPLSSSSTAAASIQGEPGPRYPRQYPRAVSTPPIPERGRAKVPSTKQSPLLPNPPPVSPPPLKSTPSVHSKESSTYIPPKPKRRSMSTATQKASTASPAPNGTSRKSSISYSAFPPPSKRESQASEPNISPVRSPARKEVDARNTMITEGASEAPNLEGIVDLKDSVDTDATTRTLPAVVREHISPRRHEIRKESITREIHTHDVYHRILPVFETKVLPTKHYVASVDGNTLVEIPESQVPKPTISETRAPNLHLGPGPASYNSLNEHSSSDSAPDGPVIGLVRGEPSTRSRGNSLRSHKSTKSSFSAKDILHPILSSRKESVSKEGHPKTEYVWRHPPVFETADGKTQPALMPAAFEGNRYYSSQDEDRAGAEFGAERAEGDLLFRDSGYGSGGMLPGLPQADPAFISLDNAHTHVGRSLENGKAPVLEMPSKIKVPEGPEGQATQYLRSMREKKLGVGSGQSKGKGVDVLENGMKGLNVNN